MKILIPISGRVPSRAEAEYLVHIAKSMDAAIKVLHITDDDSDIPAGEDAMYPIWDAALKARVKVISEIHTGEVVATILKVAKDNKIDLIVMGASEGKVVKKWLASKVLGKSDIPVVIIPQGFRHLLDKP